MDYSNLAKTWERFGETDPFWAVLAWEGKDGNNWDPEEFYQIGEHEVDFILREVEKRSPISHYQRALDFGCGVGRLTFPLAKRFDESHGVDIADSMIQNAIKYKRLKSIENATFHLNKDESLSRFPDSHFDFILSIIVLQHMEPCYFLGYIKEFIRVLSDDGILLFQLPDQTENRAKHQVLKEGMTPTMEMYGCAKDDTIAFLQSCGADVIDVHEDQSCGDNLKSYRYYVKKTHKKQG